MPGSHDARQALKQTAPYCFITREFLYWLSLLLLIPIPV